MARGGSRGRRARSQQLQVPQVPTQSTSRRGSNVTQQERALPEFIKACNTVIGCMRTYGITGIEKAQAFFTTLGQETAAQLVSPSAFTGNVTSSRLGSSSTRSTSSVTRRSTGGRRARSAGAALTAPQQQIYNCIVPGEQCNAATIAARCGMPTRNCLNAINGLKNKGYLQKVGTGRGANAMWTKVQPQLQMTA
jgi:hypothetical protein